MVVVVVVVEPVKRISHPLVNGGYFQQECKRTSKFGRERMLLLSICDEMRREVQVFELARTACKLMAVPDPVGKKTGGWQAVPQKQNCAASCVCLEELTAQLRHHRGEMVDRHVYLWSLSPDDFSKSWLRGYRRFRGLRNPLPPTPTAPAPEFYLMRCDGGYFGLEKKAFSFKTHSTLK